MQTIDTYDDAIVGEPNANDEAMFANEPTTAIGAAFADREQAHDAAHRLHDEGFSKTWIGITRRANEDGYAVDDVVDEHTGANETRVESENWFMRFFGEGDESLHDALVRHGVSEADARAAVLSPGDSVVLTVDGGNHPEFAAQIISQTGGRLISRGFGATGFGTSGAYQSDQAVAPRTTSLLEDGAAIEPPFMPASYDDYGRYRAGVSVDESTRLQLREERLRVDKSPISRTDAPSASRLPADPDERTVGVPVIREDVFIERQPAGETNRPGL